MKHTYRVRELCIGMEMKIVWNEIFVLLAEIQLNCYYHLVISESYLLAASLLKYRMYASGMRLKYFLKILEISCLFKNLTSRSS